MRRALRQDLPTSQKEEPKFRSFGVPVPRLGDIYSPKNVAIETAQKGRNVPSLSLSRIGACSTWMIQTLATTRLEMVTSSCLVR